MKKLFLFGLVLFIMTGVLGCEKSENSDGKKINEENVKEKIISMNSFSCKAEVLAISNKGQNKYNISLLWRQDGKYIIKTTSPNILDGNIILFDGNGIWQYNPNMESKISFVGIGGEFDGKSKIFISEFMKSYVNGGDSSEEEIYLSGNKYSVLTAKTDGGKYFAKQKLWININENVPAKLETYDDKDNLMFVAEFSDFKFNEKIGDEKFNISGNF